jgi:hypothetical protein
VVGLELGDAVADAARSGNAYDVLDDEDGDGYQENI